MGDVEEQKGSYRAHVQMRNAEGQNINIRGPLRKRHRTAKDDLLRIRAHDGAAQSTTDADKKHAIINAMKEAAEKLKKEAEEERAILEFKPGEP
eukprot:2907151-Karenia_brevis.AAC.1